MTDEQKGDLQALADGRSWHRRQPRQALGDVSTMQARQSAVAWLDLLSQRRRSTRLRTRRNVSGIAGPRMLPAHRSTIRHWDADTRIGAADDLARLEQTLQVPIVAGISVMGLLSQNFGSALESCEPRSIVTCQISIFIVELTEAFMNVE